MFYYNRKKFNILDGFRDNSSPIMLKGDNKYFCSYCAGLKEADNTVHCLNKMAHLKDHRP